MKALSFHAILLTILVLLIYQYITTRETLWIIEAIALCAMMMLDAYVRYRRGKKNRKDKSD